jgi:hypothetical protein
VHSLFAVIRPCLKTRHTAQRHVVKIYESTDVLLFAIKHLRALREVFCRDAVVLSLVLPCVPCRAQAVGKQRQIVEIINPINEKANNFLATGRLMVVDWLDQWSAPLAD